MSRGYWLLLAWTERDWMPSHKNEKRSNQNKCVWGELKNSLYCSLLLFIFIIIFIVSLETMLSRRLLSKTILFTFIHNKDSYIQNRHESVISVSHLWSASLPMCSSASVDSRTGLLSKLCPRTSSYYPITSLHFASTQCSNTIPDSNFK